jgi:hypothetical protein
MEKTILEEVRSLRKYILVIAVILPACYLFYNTADGDTIIFFGHEDGLFEWLTSLLYFTSFVLLFRTFLVNRNIFLLLLALVMFFGAGEEISWGQRVFGFATPEKIDSVNAQHEFNVHNLVVFNGRDMKGVNKQGWQKLTEMDLLFKIFTTCFGAILPFCTRKSGFVSGLTRRFKVPVPPLVLGIFFPVSWICLKLSLYRLPRQQHSDHYWRVFTSGLEIAEFLGSLIMMLICLYFFRNRKQQVMGLEFSQQPQAQASPAEKAATA